MTDHDAAKAGKARQMMARMMSLRQDVKRILGPDYNERMEPYRVKFRALGHKKLEVAAEAMLDQRATQIAIATIAAAVMDVYEEEARVTVAARRN